MYICLIYIHTHAYLHLHTSLYIYTYIPRWLFLEQVVRLDQAVQHHRRRLFYYLTVIRIFPMTPNFFINLAAPLIRLPLVPHVAAGFFRFTRHFPEIYDFVVMKSKKRLHRFFILALFVRLLLVSHVAAGKFGFYISFASSVLTGGPIDFKRKCRNPTVGCGMSESPNPKNPTVPFRIPQYGNSALSNNLLYKIFCFEDIKWFGYKPALTKIIRFLSRQVCIQIIWYLQNKKLVPQIIAQRWISVLRDSGRICGILWIRRFRHPTAHCGIPAFSFEVDWAPCLKICSIIH